MVVNQFGQFGALLKREIIENRNLFISTPALLAVIFFVFSVWVVSFVPSAEIATGIEYLSVLLDGLSPLQIAENETKQAPNKTHMTASLIMLMKPCKQLKIKSLF